MITQLMILLLGVVMVAMPAIADKGGTDTQDTEGSVEHEDIGDDASLITDEFSYTYLFDQKYGIIAGFGNSSPRHLMHLEGLMFLRDKLDRLGVSMLLGYAKDFDLNFDIKKYKRADSHSADTWSLSVKARYYLPVLPVSANASCGYVFWNGKIGHSGNTLDYKGSEAYFGISLSAYWFWKTGIYIESVLYGIAFSHSFGLKGDAVSEYKDDITEEIGGAVPYGIFGGGVLNLSIGYML